jgi:hypothetical protein
MTKSPTRAPSTEEENSGSSSSATDSSDSSSNSDSNSDSSSSSSSSSNENFPTMAPTRYMKPTGEFSTKNLYSIYSIVVIIVAAGTLYFCCRYDTFYPSCFFLIHSYLMNYRHMSEYFTFSQYSRLNTSDIEIFPRSRNTRQSARDIELARFERMANSLSSYPSPGTNNSNNNNSQPDQTNPFYRR